MKTYVQITDGKFYLVDGDKTVEITERDPKNDAILKLPENSSNRKWLSEEKIKKAGGKFELTYKASKHFDKTSKTTTKADWLEFLAEEERETYEELKASAEARMNDPIQIAKRAYEKAQAEYEALLAQQTAQIEESDDLGELEE